MQRVFGVAHIRARDNGVLTVIPGDLPYFEPRRVKFRAFDCSGQSVENLDFQIGAVTVGGSPQLAINTLTPSPGRLDGHNPVISPKDLDEVNWSIFSTVGLARVLQVSIGNPSDVDLLIYMCIEGYEVASLDAYEKPWNPTAKEGEQTERELEKFMAEEDKRRAKIEEKRQASFAKKREDWESESSSWQQVGSSSVELEPHGRKLVLIVPTVSPYFEPKGARYHCKRIEDGTSVPLVLVDAICGKKVLFGALLSYLDQGFEVRHRSTIEPSVDETMNLLRRQINALKDQGYQGAERARMQKIKAASVPEIEGIPTTMLEDSTFDSWHEIGDFPVFSTVGLSRIFRVLLYNPWPFRVRASITVCGNAVSDLAECSGGAFRMPVGEADEMTTE